MEQHSFNIFNFGEALSNLLAGHDIQRKDTRLRLVDDTIMMVFGEDVECPWLPTHKDILAIDWKVIRIG